MKSEKSDLLFDALPSVTRDEAMRLNKFKDGTARNQMTRLIKESIERKVDSKGNVTLAIAPLNKPYFEELQQRTKSKYGEKGKNGHLKTALH